MPRRLRFLLLTVCLAGAIAAVPAASAAPGDLDPSFGNGGTVRLLPSNEENALRAVAVQPDLKIVMAGGDYLTGSVLLVRLLPSGQMDPSFGAGGIVTTSLPGGFGEARAVALQPDGKIVIAGEAKGAVNGDFLIARYNPDGTPDTGFGGGDGVQILPVGPLQDRAEAVAIGPGGRILATGESEIDPSKDGAGVAVLKPEGNPDPAFSENGVTVLTASAEDSDEGVAIAELGDGRILVGDSTGDGAGDGFTLVRLLPSGLPDPGFGGGDGIVNTPIPGSDAGRLTDFVLRPDGRIVASGYGFDEVGSPPALDDKFAAVGYLPDGGLDASFAGTGIFTHQVAAGSEAAQAVELAPSGKILLAGSYDAAPSNSSIALMRLDPLGGLDPAFGSGGQVLRGVQAPFGELFEDAALDAEERLVVVSRAYVGGGNTELVVSRYLGDPRPPLSPPSTPRPVAANQPAHALMKAVPKKIRADKLEGFSGTAADPDGHGVKRVQIALVKRVAKRDGAKASARAARRCIVMKNAKARFKQVKPKTDQCPQRWLTVKGKEKWRFRLKNELPPGRYVVYARAVDALGLAETKFSRKLRNRYAFRVLPSR